MNGKKVNQKPSISIVEYLNWCHEEITLEEYLRFENIRVNEYPSFGIKSSNWIELLIKQSLKCYYCETELLIIQQLIISGLLKPRKRGTGGYSGLHFELDHKNCDKDDNCDENIVASCYYCNNDKSNTISCDTFKKYFGRHRSFAFKELFQDSGLHKSNQFRHHLKGKLRITSSDPLRPI